MAGWPVDCRRRDGWAGCRRQDGCRAQIGRLAAAALQPIKRALADVPGSRATCARPPVGDVVALLDVLGAVADGVVGVRLDLILDLVAVELVQLVAIDVDLRAVDVPPVDVVEVDLAVEVAVVEAVVAVDVDVAAVPVDRPTRPSRPSRRRRPRWRLSPPRRRRSPPDTSNMGRDRDSSGSAPTHSSARKASPAHIAGRRSSRDWPT